MGAAPWTWTVLGAGSILPRAGYGCAGYALERAGGEEVTLFDLGPGSLRALGNAGIDLGRVRRVLISHFHPDHCLDLYALAFARRNPAFRAPPLELVGPTGLGELLAAPPPRLARWTGWRDTELTEVEPGRAPAALERPEYRLSWVATEHTPESLAWRVDLPGGASLAYTGDTDERAQVAELARGVELLVAECALPGDGPPDGAQRHLCAAGAARLASAAGCQRLLLTHFYPSVDPELAVARARRGFGGPVEAARDGSRHGLYGASGAVPPGAAPPLLP